MALNLVEICTVKYPGQIESGNITFRFPETGLEFASWNVSGVTQPTVASVLAEEPQWVVPYARHQAFNLFLPYIEDLLDTTAQSKQYGSAVSISTYINSTNTKWAAEALAFVSWRDAVYAYSINIQTQVEAGLMPIPTMSEFQAGLPTIVWPI